MLYRKRENKIQAEQWFPGKEVEGVFLFTPARTSEPPYWAARTQCPHPEPISRGDYVVYQDDGTIVVMDRGKFELLYEPIEG